jgi:hypothetical protein
VIRQQPHDRWVIIRDQHPRNFFVRSKFDHRAVLNIESFDLASKLPHDVAPDPCCRIWLANVTRVSAGCPGASTSMKLQMS